LYFEEKIFFILTIILLLPTKEEVMIFFDTEEFEERVIYIIGDAVLAEKMVAIKPSCRRLSFMLISE
jgi:hypothetical protein